jgi:hypothetical protein
MRIRYAHGMWGAPAVPAKKAVNVSIPAELLDAAGAEGITIMAALDLLITGI